VPDPGFGPLLAIHLAARVIAEPGLGDERADLIRALVPVASENDTALDTVLGYLLIAAGPEDSSILEALVKETGPALVKDTEAPSANLVPGTVA
jgi:hypothetical protein